MDPREILRTTFGFADYRPGQREVMSALWRSRAALAVFPTGAGKSLCYQLPATMLDGVTLVVSPLIALMKDQVDFLRARGIPAARLDSSLDGAEARAVRAGMREGLLKLLFVAPERFANELFLAELRRTRVALFVIDEAHCISEWGHNFRPDYMKLAKAAHEIGAERVLALTATATPSVVEDICSGFGISPEAAVITGFYRPNLRLLTTPTAGDRRDGILIERLRARPPGSAIVYVTLQRMAESVAAMLVGEGFPARAYHAGMEAEVRNEVQEWWTASEDGIVVATIAFGMGIDKAAVRYVYHYNLPKSLESYSQEIGRAGRDGLPSVVEMLACPDDLPTLENFTYGDTPTIESIRALAESILAGEQEFEVSLREWTVRFDLKPLVLKTALTYLELLGVLHQGTPHYAEYRLKLLSKRTDIQAEFPGEPGLFIEALFEACSKGATGRARWWRLDADGAALALGCGRTRIVEALEMLRDRNHIELQAGEVRQTYTMARGDGRSATDLMVELAARFLRREKQEIERLRQVVRLVEHDGCQVNALVEHFGEQRDRPCGHCGWCETRKAGRLPRRAQWLPIGSRVTRRTIEQLASECPEALGTARQLTRFLCGLASPAAGSAKLSDRSLFGRLSGCSFGEVMAWVAAALPSAPRKSRGRRAK